MHVTDNKKPPEVDSLATDTSEGLDSTECFDKRLHRYSTAKHRALENLDELDNTIPSNPAHGVDIEKAHKRMRKCGSYLEFRQYYTVGETRLHKARFCCQPLLCPLCAIRRASKTLGSYLDKYEHIMAQKPFYRLSMVTLTVKNGSDLPERFQHLKKSVDTIFSRRRDWFKKGRGRTEFKRVHGWVGTYELTNKGKGWHPHAHIMVLHTSTFDYKALQAEWKDITGDSHVLNVSPARNPDNPAKDFAEVFKYALKFSDLTPEQNIYAWGFLKGKRLLFSGGDFRGVKIPEKLTDDPLENLPFIELFYQYTPHGYSLKQTAMHDGKDYVR